MLQAELAWFEQTVSHLKENATMQTYDVKKDRKVRYAPKPGEFAIIDVPEIAQPDWITPELVDEALAAAHQKQRPALDLLRFERFARWAQDRACQAEDHPAPAGHRSP